MSSKRKNLIDKVNHKYQELLQECKGNLEKGLIGQALEQAQQLIVDYIHQDKDKKTIEVSAFRKLGNIESWLQQYPNGPLSWYKATNQHSQIDNPFDLFNICNMIQLHLKKKEAKDLEKEYRQMGHKMEYRSELMFGLANFYYQNREYIKAEEIYVGLEEEFNDERLWECLAWTYLQLKRNKKSFQYSQKCLLTLSKNVNAEFLQIIVESDKTVKMNNLKQLAERDPTYYRVWIELGINEPDIEKSMEYFDKALGFEENSAEIHTLIGQRYLEENDLIKAREYADKAKKNDENHDGIYYLLGRIDFERKQNKKAMINFKKALSISPQCIDYQLELGKTHYEKGEHKQALESFKRCTEMNPYESDFWAWMSDTEKDLSHFDEAQRYLLKAYEMEPNIPVNLENLGFAWLEDKQYDKSLEMWIKLNHLEPNNSKHWHYIAKCYYHLQVYDRSIFWAKKSKEEENGPRKEDSLILLGQIEGKNQKFAESLQYYLELLSVKEHISSSVVIESWIQGIKNHGRGWSEKCISAIKNIIHEVINENNPAKMRNLIDVCKEVKADAEVKLLAQHIEYEKKSADSRSPSQKKSSSKKKNN